MNHRLLIGALLFLVCIVPAFSQDTAEDDLNDSRNFTWPDISHYNLVRQKATRKVLREMALENFNEYRGWFDGWLSRVKLERLEKSGLIVPHKVLQKMQWEFLDDFEQIRSGAPLARNKLRGLRRETELLQLFMFQGVPAYILDHSILDHRKKADFILPYQNAQHRQTWVTPVELKSLHFYDRQEFAQQFCERFDEAAIQVKRSKLGLEHQSEAQSTLSNSLPNFKIGRGALIFLIVLPKYIPVPEDLGEQIEKLLRTTLNGDNSAYPFVNHIIFLQLSIGTTKPPFNRIGKYQLISAYSKLRNSAGVSVLHYSSRLYDYLAGDRAVYQPWVEGLELLTQLLQVPSEIDLARLAGTNYRKLMQSLRYGTYTTHTSHPGVQHYTDAVRDLNLATARLWLNFKDPESRTALVQQAELTPEDLLRLWVMLMQIELTDTERTTLGQLVDSSLFKLAAKLKRFREAHDMAGLQRHTLDKLISRYRWASKTIDFTPQKIEAANLPVPLTGLVQTYNDSMTRLIELSGGRSAMLRK